jgi:hypothetical protein
VIGPEGHPEFRFQRRAAAAQLRSVIAVSYTGIVPKEVFVDATVGQVLQVQPLAAYAGAGFYRVGGVALLDLFEC